MVQKYAARRVSSDVMLSRMCTNSRYTGAELTKDLKAEKVCEQESRPLAAFRRLASLMITSRSLPAGAGMAGAGGGAGGSAAGAAGGVLALEVCAPLLLLCWLCCWPDDASSDSTSGKHPQRPALTHAHESGSRRRSSEVFGRRVGSSAVSLHLPSTSGYKKPLSAHRSHEEIGRRKMSQPERAEPEARYHSAPSVIDEVLHRRDWERSTRDLHVPLRSPDCASPRAPRASPDSSSPGSPPPAAPPCKKHHSNIKSSRGKKEKLSTDIKDDDATESAGFYIGENLGEGSPLHSNIDQGSPLRSNNDEHTKSVYKAKDDKQSLNESIRSRERCGVPDERHPASLGFCLDDVIEQLDRLEPLDRSGAAHRTESRASSHRAVFPPPSVEPVGYEGGACYLAESGALSELRGAGARAAPAGALRGRHASDGDILAPPHRPESGAFSGAGMAGAGGGAGGSAAGAAGGVLALEVCAPLLLLCWLCCWPDDASSDSTSGKHPQRPALTHAHESGSRRRSSEVFGRRVGSSAVSLHLPSTSGYKKPLSAHRSHEEIGRRKMSQPERAEPEARYHSAPSVIDEVLHRRDWERSTRDLHVPLRSPDCASPRAPRASPDSSSPGSPPPAAPPCKKHHSNIKSSRGKKEKLSTDIKDDDATESAGFYIGENLGEGSPLHSNIDQGSPLRSNNDEHTKSVYKAKDDKQSLNESIRSRERCGVPDERHPASLGFCLDDVIEQLDRLEPLDRSGAAHRTESRASSHRAVFPPPSVEPVGYEGGACYLAESGALSELRGAGARAAPAGALRGRHASDGDILAPPHRPESGAFSESDLDLELEGAEERPPPYEELQQYAPRDTKETAI
uniref:Uncharacterized protein n=1 Tax=Heliothis virescens TaxID=7102 RepID=A0A2A4K1A2_HELVI